MDWKREKSTAAGGLRTPACQPSTRPCGPPAPHPSSHQPDAEACHKTEEMSREVDARFFSPRPEHPEQPKPAAQRDQPGSMPPQPGAAMRPNDPVGDKQPNGAENGG
jgi:hypothetical protein